MGAYDRIVTRWQAWKIRSVPELELRLGPFPILFAYHSGKIENGEIAYPDAREIFETGKAVGFTGSPRTLFELQNQKICYDVLKEKIISKEPLSLSLILEVHRTLTQGCYDEGRYVVNGERPGAFKKHDYVTGENEVGSSPQAVEGDLVELLEEVNAIGGQSPLKAGAYFHARFENIHPFADGNGRVGRTLLNYWLMLNNYPPLIVFEEDKRSYYKALQMYDEQEVIDPLVDFLEGQAEKTWGRSMGFADMPEVKRGFSFL